MNTSSTPACSFVRPSWCFYPWLEQNWMSFLQKYDSASTIFDHLEFEWTFFTGVHRGSNSIFSTTRPILRTSAWESNFARCGVLNVLNVRARVSQALKTLSLLEKDPEPLNSGRYYRCRPLSLDTLSHLSFSVIHSLMRILISIVHKNVITFPEKIALDCTSAVFYFGLHFPNIYLKSVRYLQTSLCGWYLYADGSENTDNTPYCCSPSTIIHCRHFV